MEPIIGRAKYCDLRVFLYVFQQAYLKTQMSKLHQISTYVAYAISVAQSSCDGDAYAMHLQWFCG